MVLRAQQPAVARIAKTVDAEDVVPEPRTSTTWRVACRVDLPDEVEGLKASYWPRSTRLRTSVVTGAGITGRLDVPGTTRLRGTDLPHRRPRRRRLGLVVRLGASGHVNER